MQHSAGLEGLLPSCHWGLLPAQPSPVVTRICDLRLSMPTQLHIWPPWGWHFKGEVIWLGNRRIPGGQ